MNYHNNSTENCFFILSEKEILWASGNADFVEKYEHLKYYVFNHGMVAAYKKTGHCLF